MENKTILIVEDEQAILNLLKDNLEEHSFKVISSTNPLWVLENVDFNKIDFIVSDIRMPGIDGVQLIYRIKELGFDIPVFFMTGYSDYSREALNALNPKAIIFKPFDTEEMCLLIKNYFQKS